MSQNFAVLVYGPGAGTQVNVTSSASAGALLTADAKYQFVATAMTNIRFGATSAVAAATTDVWIPANTAPVTYTVPRSTPYVSFITATTATLNYAIVG